MITPWRRLGRMRLNREGCFAFDVGKDEEALDGGYVGERGEFVPVEVAVGFHVDGGDAQDKINGAGHLETFHYLGEAGDRLFEVVEGFFGVVGQQDVAECDESSFEFSSVEDSHHFFDIALFFQTSDPLMDCCHRLVQFECYFFVGQGSILLQQA